MIYNNGELPKKSLTNIKWSKNYKEFNKKCMKLEPTEILINELISIGDRHTRWWTNQQMLK